MSQYDKALATAQKSPGYHPKAAGCFRRTSYFSYKLQHSPLSPRSKNSCIQEAAEALSLYEKIPKKGIHYANALNLQAVLAMDAGKYAQAHENFLKSADYIKTFLGKNEDYHKAIANADKAATAIERKSKKDSLSSTANVADRDKTQGFGLALCRDYYETIGQPTLQAQFASVWHRIAIGLVGEGSECLGFDDELSRDHDWVHHSVCG